MEVGNWQRIAYDWWCDSKHKLGSSNDQIIHVYICSVTCGMWRRCFLFCYM
jgi:hypothetical protein